MPIRPQRFATHTFLDQVQARLFAVVRVGRRLDSFHPGVAEYFDDRYPQLFSFGLLDRNDVRQDWWWDDHFRTSVGVLRAGVQDGYHLFHAGLVAAHHGGAIRSAHATYADERDRAVEREKALRHGFKGARVVNPNDLEACRQIVAPLVEIVERKQAVSGFGTSSGARASSDPSRWVTEDHEPVDPPADVVAQRGPEDPFELLEVSPDASLDEIKSAYKRSMKLNHPDKVAHMSQAIQDFALDRSRRIKKAFDGIAAMKGSG